MTQTCVTCFDRYCDKVGADLRACEHYVRLSDVEPEPEADPPGLTAPWLDCPFFDQCEEIVTRLRRVERALCDIGRSVRGELP